MESVSQIIKSKDVTPSLRYTRKSRRCYTQNNVERPIYRFLHLIFAFGTLHLLVLLGLETMRLFQTNSEISLAQQRVGILETKVSQLKEDVESAQTPSYREAMVRRLGYVQRGETPLP